MDKVLILLCGKLDRRTFSLPIPFQIISDIQNLTTVIDNPALETRFIVLYYDRLDPSSAHILCPLSCKGNVDVVVLGGNLLNDLPPNQINRLRLSDDLATYKAILCGIHAYQSIAKRYYASNDKDLAAYFDAEAKKLLRWWINNIRVGLAIFFVFNQETRLFFISVESMPYIAHSIEYRL